MNPCISGLGVWFPEQVIYNSAWSADFGKVKEGDRTFNDIPLSLNDAGALSEHYLKQEANDPFLGTVERRKASIWSRDAEYLAAKNAIDDAGLTNNDIDVVISYTTIPDRIVPASASYVAHRLGLKNAVAFGMDAACATLMTQLMTAVGMIQSGQVRNVLLTQSHLILKALPFLHPATPGLGDAATACVVTNPHFNKPKNNIYEIVKVHTQTHPEYYEAVTWIRDNEEDIRWWKCGGDFRLGSENREQAKQLMRDTVEFGSRTISEAVNKLHIQYSKIPLSHIFSVQPRGWIPGAIAQHLGMPKEAAVTTYEKYAHIGACGPIVNWHYARNQIKEGDMFALYAQGAGFTRGSVILDRIK